MNAKDFFDMKLITDASSVIYKNRVNYSRNDLIRFADAYFEFRLNNPASHNLEAQKCDACGCTPSVVIRTKFGTFCEQHVRYI